MMHPAASPPRRRLGYDTRVLLGALAAGLPGVLAASLLAWLAPLPGVARLLVPLLVVAAWVSLSLSLRSRVVGPIRTLANILAAFREGDFSIRLREEDVRGSLGLAYHELNGLEAILRDQRIGAVEASALLRRVLAELDVVVFAFDEAGRLRLLNRAAERLLGRSEGEVVGKTADELRLQAVLSGPAPRTLELNHPGGSGRWEVRRSVARQEGERLQLVVLSDLRRALREEEREAWKRLIRVLSHEINNSLAPIQSISSSLIHMLEEGAAHDPPDEDLARGLEVIHGRAVSLNRFMAAYATLARLPPPELQPVAVGSWVGRVAKLETRSDVRVRPGPGITILADQVQLEQALINLIRNAVEATEETGGEVSVGWSVAGDTLEVMVEDEGPGLHGIANLFVPLYTTKPNGSGIGLALSLQIAEGHGGRLVLEEREDTPGTRARLSLPVGRAAEGRRP